MKLQCCLFRCASISWISVGDWLINVFEILSNLGHIFRVCLECVQSVFRVCSECIQCVFRVCSECVLSVFWVFSGCVQSVFWVCSECVQSVFRVCSECVQYWISSLSACSVSIFGFFLLCVICTVANSLHWTSQWKDWTACTTSQLGSGWETKTMILTRSCVFWLRSRAFLHTNTQIQ